MTNHPFITLATQMLIYASILYALHFVTKQVGDPKQRMLTRVSIGFVAMVLIYVVDKMAPQVDMLSVATLGALSQLFGSYGSSQLLGQNAVMTQGGVSTYDQDNQTSTLRVLNKQLAGGTAITCDMDDSGGAHTLISFILTVT